MNRFVLAISILGVLAAGAMAAGTESETATGPDLAPIRVIIDAGKYPDAIVALKAVSLSAPSADVFNLLAYAERKSGDLANAEVHYAKALELDANHKGALEYQGELFILQKQVEKANANLAKLAELCPSGCEERSELEAAIKKSGLTN
jgi:Flp pilus assembly protein TadD